MPLAKLFSYFKHDNYGLSHAARLLPVVGAFLSIYLIATITQLFIPDAAQPILVASMGASAVLLFVVPSSPMAQPWPFVGGHFISSFIGITCFFFIPNLYLASAAAVSLSILAMIYLNCLHPPGGAAALAFILAGPETQTLAYQYLLIPIAINVALLLAMSQLFHKARFLFKRRPRVQLSPLSTVFQNDKNQAPVLFTESDLDSALKDMGTFIDISHQDLTTIYSLALTHSRLRSHVGKACKDIMLPALYTVEFGSSLEDAWHIIQDNELLGLCVIDRSMHLIGIITYADFIKHAESMKENSLEEKIEALIAPSRLLESSKPEVVGQIMSAQVVSVNLDDDVSTIVPIFKQYEECILPVTNNQNRLQGVIISSDL